ncbi:hypothetical protein DGG96_09440 [Legionella qingyii]|uniref:Uncharacterized protein n=1 Tax=Legionella qingyii TaxID=2184757 RepID=A0A317U3W0_9GAMM|nr:hypothetical protein DGG96_09440 [Legionella qingyii]
MFARFTFVGAIKYLVIQRELNEHCLILFHVYLLNIDSVDFPVYLHEGSYGEIETLFMVSFMAVSLSLITVGLNTINYTAKLSIMIDFLGSLVTIQAIVDVRLVQIALWFSVKANFLISIAIAVLSSIRVINYTLMNFDGSLSSIFYIPTLNSRFRLVYITVHSVLLRNLITGPNSKKISGLTVSSFRSLSYFIKGLNLIIKNKPNIRLSLIIN